MDRVQKFSNNNSTERLFSSIESTEHLLLSSIWPWSVQPDGNNCNVFQNVGAVSTRDTATPRKQKWGLCIRLWPWKPENKNWFLILLTSNYAAVTLPSEVGFEVLTAVSMKIAVFWVVARLHGATTQKTAIFTFWTPLSKVPLVKLTVAQLAIKFPAFYWTLKLFNRVHKSLPMGPVLRQMNKVPHTHVAFLYGLFSVDTAYLIVLHTILCVGYTSSYHARINGSHSY
jgi:hypothetical protein